MKYSFTRFISLLVFTSVVVFTTSCSSNESSSSDQQLSMFEEEELKFTDETTNKTLIRLMREGLDLQRIRLDSLKDVRPLEGKTIIPAVYNKYLPVQYLEPELRRQKFIEQVLPHILVAKYGLDRERKMLEEIRKIADGESDEAEVARNFIRNQIKKYKASSYQDLLERLTTHPVSIVLAQAITETNWGMARFFEEGNNLFGFKSSDPKKPKIESLTKEKGETVYFRRYIEFLPESVVDYFKLISTDDRFVIFREKRSSLDDPLALVEFLDEYHPEVGGIYVDKLKEVIDKYNLTKYDAFVIDEDFKDQISEKEVDSIVREATIRKRKIVDTNSKKLRKIAQETLRIQYKKVKEVEDIVPIKGERVVPYVYESVVSLKYLPVAEKKQKFLDLMIPAILVTNHAISQARVRLDNVYEQWQNGESTSPEDSAFVEKLKHDWRAETIPALQDKLITRPTSIVLAQAALETGWGSSRFFIKANNVFGVWSFDPNESRIAAGQAREDMQVYVKRYPNISASIYDYFKTIARGPYSAYREKRLETDDPFTLVNYLTRYSEMGQHYINSLKIVMRKADLQKYDDYRLDPAYVEYEYEKERDSLQATTNL